MIFLLWLVDFIVFNGSFSCNFALCAASCLVLSIAKWIFNLSLALLVKQAKVVIKTSTNGPNQAPYNPYNSNAAKEQTSLQSKGPVNYKLMLSQDEAAAKQPNWLSSTISESVDSDFVSEFLQHNFKKATFLEPRYYDSARHPPKRRGLRSLRPKKGNWVSMQSVW